MNRQGFIDGFLYKLATEATAKPISQPRYPISYSEFQKNFDKKWQGGGIAGNKSDTAYQIAIREAYKKYIDSFKNAKPVAPVYKPSTNIDYRVSGPSASALMDIGRVLSSLSDPDTSSRIASNK